MVDKYFLDGYDRKEYILKINHDVSNNLETKSSLGRMYHKPLFENRDILLIDLGKKIPIYDWYFHPKLTIEHYNVKKITEYKLHEIAAAHKEYNNNEIRLMLKDAADYLRKASKGGVITTEGYNTIIEEAIYLKDVTEVETNYSIRFLENPYYLWNKTFSDRKQIKATLINLALGSNRKDSNYKSIEHSIIDYDLNNKSLTKPILVNITGLSISTIKNYLKNYPHLNECFIAIKGNSGTTKQLKDSFYNNRKLVKRLSA